jgi:hypothetical protein
MRGKIWLVALLFGSALLASTLQDEINSRSNGWHLLGSGTDVASSTILSGDNVVWSYQNGAWHAKSNNSDTNNSLTAMGIQPLDTISQNSGFWLDKK